MSKENGPGVWAIAFEIEMMSWRGFEKVRLLMLPFQSNAFQLFQMRFPWGTPHPYFGRKILVFLRLQAGVRCKIVKTKEFPAKSSRIRSYGPFWPLLTASGWQAARKGPPGR